MSDSLFSSLRIVAMMLAADGTIAAKERSWFLAVMNSFGATSSQRSVLRDHLRGVHKESLEAIIDRVKDLKDRSGLLNFLKMAMQIDEVISPSEMEFFSQVKNALEKEKSGIDYTDYGRSLVQRDQEIHLWKSLGEVGRTLSWKRGVYFGIHPRDRFHIGFVALFIAELIFHETYVRWTFAALLIFISVLILFLH